MTEPRSMAALAARIEAADLERQQDRSNLETHERICSERYLALNLAHTEFKAQLTSIGTTVQKISENQAANTAVAAAAISNGKPKWWMQLTGAAVIGLIGWMGATIWNLQNARVDAALRRETPAATVTVNPTQQQQPQVAEAPPQAPEPQSP